MSLIYKALSTIESSEGARHGYEHDETASSEHAGVGMRKGVVAFVVLVATGAALLVALYGHAPALLAGLDPWATTRRAVEPGGQPAPPPERVVQPEQSVQPDKSADLEPERTAKTPKPKVTSPAIRTPGSTPGDIAAATSRGEPVHFVFNPADDGDEPEPSTRLFGLMNTGHRTIADRVEARAEEASFRVVEEVGSVAEVDEAGRASISDHPRNAAEAQERVPPATRVPETRWDVSGAGEVNNDQRGAPPGAGWRQVVRATPSTEVQRISTAVPEKTSRRVQVGHGEMNASQRAPKTVAQRSARTTEDPSQRVRVLNFHLSQAIKKRDEEEIHRVLDSMQAMLGADSLYMLKIRAFAQLATGGDIEYAMSLLQEVLILDPGDKEALFNMAVAEIKLGEVEEARNRLTTLAGNYPGDRRIGELLRSIQ